MRILLLDDCEETGILVKQSLFPLEVIHALSIQKAKTILENMSFDLLLIDITLPDGDGFSFCSEISKNPHYSATPLILLTAKDEVSDKVFGLNCGACDYITKPFHLPELKARINAHLRHKRLVSDFKLKSKFFELDANLQKCYIFKKDIPKDSGLTPTEFRILMSLFKNRGVAMSREEIIRAVWKNHGTSIEQKGLDTHVAHLRRKLAKAGSQIVSVYGVGYVFEE